MKSFFEIYHLAERFAGNLFITGQENYTFASFFEIIQSVAENLESSGIRRGDTIIISDASVPETVFLLFAVTSLKAAVLPINPQLSEYEIAEIKNTSNAKWILSESRTGKNVLNIRYLFEKPKQRIIKQHQLHWDYNIPAIIILTSGSSGDPKLAVHSLMNLFFSAHAVNTWFGLEATDRWLLSLPLYHVSGIAIVFRCLLCGSSITVPDNRNIMESINIFRPTHLSFVHTQLWRLMDNPGYHSMLKEIPVIFLGGSAIPVSLLEKSLNLGLNIFTSYGLTEMASTVAIKKITDLSTDRAEIIQSARVKISEKNEILLKGKSLFLGYLQNGKITKNNDTGGWFRSGDLGQLDSSHITVWGRMDNMFISGGENIYPEEIEKFILMTGKVENAIVVAEDDEEFGQRPVAFLKKKDEITDVQIRSDLKKYLPSYKIPRRFLPWPQIENENNLKLKRSFFRSLL